MTRPLRGGPVEALAALLGLVAAAWWSAVRNLGAAPVTYDEDEVVYFGLADAAARLIYRLEPGKLLEQLTGGPRPPLVAVTDAVLLLLLPEDPTLLAFGRLLWMGLLLWQVAGLASDLVDRSGAAEATRRRATFLAVLLTATAPAVLQLGASLMYEVPLAAASTVALRLLLRVSWERRAPMAVAAGVVCGLGLLLKWTFPVAVIGPAAVLVGRTVRAKEPMRPWFIVAGVAALVAAPWYLPAASVMVPFLLDASVGEGSKAYGAATRSFGEEWGYYLPVVASKLLWWPLAVAAIWGLVRFVRERRPTGPVLLAAVVVPALLFSVLTNKEVRYLLPIVPALAAAGAVGLATLEKQRTAMLVTVAGLGLASVLQGVPLQGADPFDGTVKKMGPLTIRWDRGAGIPKVPVDVLLRSPIGAFALQSRGDLAFPYRHASPARLPIEEIGELVQRTNPGAHREAAVLSPETWLWTPLWAHALQSRGWTRWRTSQCDAFLVGEAAYFLSLEPPGEPTEHCRQNAVNALAEFRALKPKLQSLGSWEAPGLRLTLWVYRDRLYPDQAARTEAAP